MGKGIIILLHQGEKMLEKILELIIVPICIGVLSSIAFLWLLRSMRPSFDISKQIAKFESKKGTHQYGYTVKVINKSKRSAVDIKVQLAIVYRKFVPDGIISRNKELNLIKSDLIEIPAFSKKDPEKSAFRFTTYQDIENIWHDEDTHIVFIIYAKDELTGFGKIFKQDYYIKRTSIKNGSFRRGDSMDIM